MKKPAVVKKAQSKAPSSTSLLILELALLLSLVAIFFALYMQGYVDHMLLQDRIYILEHMQHAYITPAVSITPTP